MGPLAGPAWSDAVEETSWIGERLAPFGAHQVTSVVPGDPLTRVEDWVARWVDEATARLLASGEAIITTSRGTVDASLERSSWPRRGRLRVSSRGDNGVSGSGERMLSRADEEELRAEIVLYLTCEVIGLVGG